MVSSLDEYMPGEDTPLPMDESRQAIALTFVESIDRLVARWGSGLEHLEDLRNDIILEYRLHWIDLTFPLNPDYNNPVSNPYGW